ncbi:outer membrane beta-barrel protein [Bacteroidota bacterium]
MKRGPLTIIFFLISIPIFVNAQDVLPERKDDNLYLSGTRPDLPGILGFDFGLNYVNDFPGDMKLKWFNSRYFSGYYKFSYTPHSMLSIHPGIAFGGEKFDFHKDVTLRPGEDSIGNYQTQLYGLDSLINATSIKRSQLSTAYIEIPLEITFRTHSNPKKAFKVTVGGKVGLLIDSKTKIKYRQDGKTKIIKDKQNFGLNSWRFNVIGRIGYGDFSLFYQYSITELFEKNKGPFGTTGHPMTYGISFNLF